MRENVTADTNLHKLLHVTEDSVPLVTQDDWKAYYKHVDNIQKEYWERDRVVPAVAHNIITHLNPYSKSDGGCERKMCNAEDRIDCSSS